MERPIITLPQFLRSLTYGDIYRAWDRQNMSLGRQSDGNTRGSPSDLWAREMQKQISATAANLERPANALTLHLEELENFEIRQLAQFLKRVGFDTCLRHTDNASNNDQAYAMIAGLEAVRRALAEHGYCPR